ncbi:histone-lysine N-methyltransferase SETDB1-B-like [Pholidichthys leucotaenia]
MSEESPLLTTNGEPDSLNEANEAVIVMSRLRKRKNKISDEQQPSPQLHSDLDSPCNSDSDAQWEPEDDSSGSDFSPSGSNKNKAAKRVKRGKTSKTSFAAAASTTKGNIVGPVIISSAFASNSKETTKVPFTVTEVEFKVNMAVIARKRAMLWQRGKIMEIVTKEDGRLKYKINFDEKGKSLVSAHHMALDNTPKLDQLFVGARVVIQSQANKQEFHPGILAELPSRKNRLRFMVFLDDHTPMYIGLQFIHLVGKPLEDVLEDIPESPHKDFIKEYLKDWPYPHLTQYKSGEFLNVELNGVLQKCEVQEIDCSLMKVLFPESEHTEWIYRGTLRLEHMAKFLEKKSGEEAVDEKTDDSE